MKSSDKPEISKKWWTKEKPSEIKGNDLEKALASCESALADVKKKENEDTVAAALESLKELSGAVDDTVKECEKKKLKDVATVLGKFDKLISDKTKDLEKCQAAQAKESEGEEEDEEEGKTVFKEEYLARMIKMLRGGEALQFAIGLNKQTPAESRLVLCNKRKSERLHKMLKQQGEFSNRLMTHGSATGEGKILQLTLSDDAKEPSQIVKTAKGFFRNHKDLKYRKIRIIAGGQTFEEDMPEDENVPPGRVAAGENKGGAGNGHPNGSPADPNKRKLFVQAKSKWMKARDKAEQDLEVVKDGIRDHYIDDVEQYPIAVKKLKELDDIFENLSHDLRDALDNYVHTPLNKKQQLEELAASARQLVDKFADYVEGSQLLTAIDQKEFADVQIKAPLSAALRELEKTLA
jgi:hypothetical protein